MPYVYVSKKADRFSGPVYHCNRACGSVEYLDDNDTLTMVWVQQRRQRILVVEYTKWLRKCDKCCV